MRLNLSKIVAFYKTDIGAYVTDALSCKISDFCRKLHARDKTIVASIGCMVHADMLAENTECLTIQMYDTTHADTGMAEGYLIQTTRAQWPYRAENVDGIVMIHDLEFAENPDVYLREAWRVLKGEGRLLMIVPNRMGRWARQDNNPFGQGYPFSIDQIERLLSAAHFQIDAVDRALFFPPYEPKTFIARLYRTMIERLKGLYCMNSGVLVIEASKHVYAPTRGLKEITAEGARKIIMNKGKVGASSRSSKTQFRDSE